MRLKLLYHRFGSEHVLSPFDEAILSIARDDAINITCPYMGFTYLQRILHVCRSWKLVTDVEEWLASQTMEQRAKIYPFLNDHAQTVRHCPMLHAKAVIGSRSAYFGSANLTQTGVKRRVEMGAYVCCDETVRELRKWFESLWSQSQVLELEQLEDYLNKLPEPTSSFEEGAPHGFTNKNLRSMHGSFLP